MKITVCGRLVVKVEIRRRPVRRRENSFPGGSWIVNDPSVTDDSPPIVMPVKGSTAVSAPPRSGAPALYGGRPAGICSVAVSSQGRITGVDERDVVGRQISLP